jgi:hypothetical protein
VIFDTVLIRTQKNALAAKSVAVLRKNFKEYRVKAEGAGNVAEKQQNCSTEKMDRIA